MLVTVVIPIHNEADFLPAALPRLVAELADLDSEVTLMENGSTDDTVEVARAFANDHPGISVISRPEADYGAAMRDGFLRAKGDWVANMDIDYFSGEFIRAALAIGADVVVASKRVAGAEDRRSPFRRLATYTFNRLMRLLLGSKLSDTHGMKLLRAEVVADVGSKVKSTQDLFDTELVVRAERAGYTIAEVPAVVEELRETRSSLLSRVPRTLRGLLRIRKSLRSERG